MKYSSIEVSTSAQYRHDILMHLWMPKSLHSSSSLFEPSHLMLLLSFPFSSLLCSLYSAKRVLKMEGSMIGCSQLGSVPLVLFGEVLLKPLRDFRSRLSWDFGLPIRSSSSIVIRVGQCILCRIKLYVHFHILLNFRKCVLFRILSAIIIVDNIVHNYTCSFIYWVSMCTHLTTWWIRVVMEHSSPTEWERRLSWQPTPE